MTSTTSVRFETTVVFDWNYNAVERVKVNQGGTSSGKTYAILQVIFLKLIQKKRIATIVGQDVPNLKKGALRDFQERILVNIPWFNLYIESYNKSDRIYKFRNGSIMEFTSFGDEQDAKNGKRDIAFFNEANGIPYLIYRQVAMRTSEDVYIDYNPTAPFWAHEYLIGKKGVVTFYSNFTHNPFLDDSVRNEILSLKYEDLEAWKVYGLGKTGSVAGLVIENMTVVPEMPSHLKRRAYAIDFGYRAHPTALIQAGLANERDLYFDQLFYLRNMKTRDIHLTMNALGISKKRKIIADGADARACDDLKDRGWNIQEVIKGRDSVMYGVELINQYNIHVTQRSVDMIEERGKYRYKVEKRGDYAGMVKNEPIKAFDDTWDAARYYTVTFMRPIRKTRTQYRGGVV